MVEVVGPLPEYVIGSDSRVASIAASPSANANDDKYQKSFDEVFQQVKCEVNPITPCSPNLQAHVERVIQTYQHECLDQFAVVSERQMNYIGREIQSWYNIQRPHSSVNSLPPADQSMPVLNKRDSTQDTVCTTKLGGLLKTYSRRAASHDSSITVE